MQATLDRLAHARRAPRPPVSNPTMVEVSTFG